LWLFGQFAGTGSSAASYQQAEEPVSQLINEFGPPVASLAAAHQRAARCGLPRDQAAHAATVQ